MVAWQAIEAVTLVLATEADAPALAGVSRLAFESDADHGSPFTDGPHGYASAAWQRDMMHCVCGYWKIMREHSLVGGAIVLHGMRGRFQLRRFYIHPAHQRQGCGREAMRILLATYPEARCWTVEVPAWSRRAQQFYQELGFQPRRRDRDMIIYQMICSD